MEDDYLYLLVNSKDLSILNYTNEKIKEITDKKLKQLYNNEITENLLRRYEQELRFITENGLEHLYMFLYSIAEKSKKDNEVIILRGTICSSLITYLLGISFIDPIKYNIPFETYSLTQTDKMKCIDFDLRQEYIENMYSYIKSIFDAHNIKYSSETNCINDNTVKINFISNNHISVLKQLEQATGVAHNSIDITDSNILKLFQKDNFNTLHISYLDYFIGPREIKIVNKVHPTSIDDLIKISALIHGTDVWENNVENLIKEHNIKDIACSRDDIFLLLVDNGISKDLAFKIMEFISKGNAYSTEKQEQWFNYINIMQENNIPQWYINSLEKIRYMFPKAHCTNLTICILWIAWYCINYEDVFKKKIERTKNV